MRISRLLPGVAAFVLAAAVCVLGANFAVSAIEDGSEIAVRRALDENELGWAEVYADGLKVVLSGTAPSEALRFQAVSVTGQQVDAARVIDQIEVAAIAAMAPPRFSAEILRNDSGITIIGLVPRTTDRDALVQRIASKTGESRISDLLETAEYAVPAGWDDAMAFAETALARMPRSKISVEAGAVRVTAMSDSTEERDAAERDLQRRAPPGLTVSLAIAAPRPVITPFTMRYVLEEGQGRFDACSAESDETGAAIVAAAIDVAPLQDRQTCTVGLGVPSPDWGVAVAKAIRAVGDLGGGSVTFSDADISLAAFQGADQAVFDSVVGELEANLPDLFALHALFPELDAGEAEAGPAEFLATLSPEGLVQMRGRLSDEPLRHMATSYAQSAFGSENVYMAARLSDRLPDDWPTRVLVSLQALSMLSHGSITVGPDQITVRGTTRSETGQADVARLLAAKLGETALFSLDITYVPPPPPIKVRPEPEECAVMLQTAQVPRKIAFEPGSATIAEGSLDVVNRIADILRECGDIRLEIQGHTDSQGRESMNLELSQARADSVLNELRARRVLTASYDAKGYGEARPIADNKTEEGREENRRIEFHLIRPEATDEEATGLEEAEAAAAAQAADGSEVEADGTAAAGTNAENEGTANE